MYPETYCVICNSPFIPKREKTKTCTLESCKYEHKKLLKKARKRTEIDQRTEQWKRK